MKYEDKQITEEALRSESPVEKAMNKAFALAPPPMPDFEEAVPLPSYAQALSDDDLDDLAAATGVEMLDQIHLLQKPGKRH